MNNIPSLGPSTIPEIEPLIFSCNGVKKQLQSLKNDKAPGPDNLYTWLLKLAANEIAPTLTVIFQSLLESGILPSQWKEANICGVFKKGSKSNPENYRLISLTCTVCKIMEHILHSHIMKHLERHDIPVDSQHGFRSRRSTETQLDRPPDRPPVDSVG